MSHGIFQATEHIDKMFVWRTELFLEACRAASGTGRITDDDLGAVSEEIRKEKPLVAKYDGLVSKGAFASYWASVIDHFKQPRADEFNPKSTERFSCVEFMPVPDIPTNTQPQTFVGGGASAVLPGQEAPSSPGGGDGVTSVSKSKPAACKGSNVQDAQGLSLKQIRASWPCKSFGSIVYDDFALALQSHLVRSLLCGWPSLDVVKTGSAAQSIKLVPNGLEAHAGVGLDNIHLAPAKVTTPCINMLPERFRLNFVGKVSRAPSSGALPVCSFGGENFFITGSGYNSADDEVFSPAWLIPVVGSGKKGGTGKDGNDGKDGKDGEKVPSATLDYKKVTTDFMFTTFLGALPQQHVVKITVFQLAIPDSVAADGAGKAYLQRNPIAEQLSVEQAKPKAAKPKSKSEARAKPVPSPSASMSKWTKHIYATEKL